MRFKPDVCVEHWEQHEHSSLNASFYHFYYKDSITSLGKHKYLSIREWLGCGTLEYRVLYPEGKNEDILFIVIRDLLDILFHEKGTLQNNM